MAINTSKTIGKASTVMGKKVENTAKNMAKMLKDAGVKGTPKSVTVPLIMNPGEKDDVFFIGLNGVSFYFKKGTTVSMPEPLLEIALNAGLVSRAYLTKDEAGEVRRIRHDAGTDHEAGSAPA